MAATIARIGLELRPILFCLWSMWAALLFVPIGLALAQQTGNYHIPNWCMLASSVVLVIVGWTWYAALQARGPTLQFSTVRRIALLMTAGMALGTLGDFFNSGRLQEIIHLANPMLGGLTAFLIGHVFYIAACVLLAKRCNFSHPAAWWLSIVVWQAIAILSWYFVLFLSQTEATFVWAALPYSMLLAGTAGVTSSLAWHAKRLTPLALGAALFFVSDLILGYQISHERIFPNGEPVWLTYGPGQMLIVFAIGAMVTQFGSEQISA